MLPKYTVMRHDTETITKLGDTERLFMSISVHFKKRLLNVSSLKALKTCLKVAQGQRNFIVRVLTVENWETSH